MINIVSASHTVTRAEIVVEGDSIEELMRSSTSNAAIEKAASLGLHRPGISNSTGVYPVDAAGEASDAVLSGKSPVAGYRRDYVILGSI